MIKQLQIALFLVFFFIVADVSAQFPYIESFRGATATGITFGGAPSAFLTAGGSGYEAGAHTGTPLDANGEGYLRLTNNTKNQKGYIYSNANFPSTEGLSAEFEYYIYGGNGADGISFFLFDATASPFVIGGFGGSLGYAQINTTNPISPGVSKGYLAIGLDEFGNFSNPTEGRQGGIPGLRPGSVTLRGKGNGSGLTPENYKFLTTVRTADPVNGVPGFSLVGSSGARQPIATNQGYRKVYLDLVPNPAGGYNITVRITRGGSPMVTSTVIDNFYYPETAPATLRYGLASSTGNQTNFHEIRNVIIDIYKKDRFVSPTAVNDEAIVCQGKTTSINVFANDVSNNDGGIIVTSSIDLDPLTIGIQSTYSVQNKGIFSLDQQGLVLFTPEASFTGLATANYTVKDSYGKESNVAAISLTYASLPVSVNAGPDKLVNVSAVPAAFFLEASVPSAGQGIWTQVSGPNTAVFTNSATNNTTVTNLTGGIYIFRWTVKSAGGCEVTDDVQITINNIPVANDDVFTTSLNTFIALPVLINDIDANGNTTIDKSSVLIKSQPLHGSLVTDPVTGTVTYRPEDGYSGFDSFVYTIKDDYGAESNTAIVTIAINSPKPVAPDISADAISGRPKKIDIIPPACGTIIITSQPKHGTVTVNPVTAEVLYTADPDYSGADDFTYIIRDCNGAESTPGRVNLSVKIPARIGLAKALTAITKNLDGSYDLKYVFTIVNFGDIQIKNVSLVDDLGTAFPGASIIIRKLTGSGTLAINQSYDGKQIKEMLLPSSMIQAKFKLIVELEVTIGIVDGGTFNNTAFTKGLSESDGGETNDQSTNGLNPDPVTPGDYSPSIPTPAVLTAQDIIIPGGFSPNGDGINDFFTIENSQGKLINLEIYNRWANRIYRSADYKNNWNGKTTEGIYVGNEVPAGTYYYIIIINGKERRVGYLTISR
ncbi:Ig-like domain-containing protein [Pedobacter ginsengisoli]|uniref:Ig-like domain-containing protein n=1 Tax=Pedobacter ginsengisoli TaxID=363852 RepID=UPI00254FA903|nr:Ig-like domain-containing protein [Pedobacter ginsengisoli]